MGFFDTLFAPFNANIGADAAAQAAAAQTAGINQGMGALTNQYGLGRNALNQNFMAGLQPFMQNFQTGYAGTTALNNALGLNGPGGVNDAFKSYAGVIAPSLQLGSENVARQAAAAGGGVSGAEKTALSQLGQQTGMQGWQNYVSNLSPYFNMTGQAATGIGGLYSGLGGALNQNYMGLGQGLASGYGAQGAAQANADLAAAQAQYGAGGNLWGAGLGIGNLISSGLSRFLPTGSDIRIKDDVERIGTLNDGLPIYRFRYKGSPRTEVGLMAQDVEQVNPEAVMEIGGVKHVDYRRATHYAADLDRFLMAA
jgi:hypothetical protein